MGIVAVAVNRIGVTGWKGRLGSELVRRGCLPVEADVTDFNELGRALLAIKPDVVVHCAAYTDVDMCEVSPLHAARVNMGGTYGLCQVFRGKIVYLSTDYIFDGRGGPYDEDARPNPLGIYGWSKLGGEIVVRQRREKGDLIVRTTVLFDCYSENFITRVIRKLLGGETLTLPMNLIGSPTYIPDLAQGILDAIAQNVMGVLNLAGDRLMSRLQIGEYLAGKLELENRILSGPPTGPTNRPRKAGLTVDKARQLGLTIGDPKKGMREVVRHALETVGTR